MLTISKDSEQAQGDDAVTLQGNFSQDPIASVFYDVLFSEARDVRTYPSYRHRKHDGSGGSRWNVKQGRIADPAQLAPCVGQRDIQAMTLVDLVTPHRTR
jgi:hypothetical protein